MAQSNEITAAMQDHLGQHAADLLTLAYNSMDVIQDVTFYPDVKNKLVLSTFEIDNIVRPFNADAATSTDKFRFVPRELDVKVAMAKLKVIPELYRQTYLAKYQRPGIAKSPEDMPFSQYVLEQIFEKFGGELNDDTAYLGVHDANGTDPVDVANGFGTILASEILAGNVTPKNLGAITATDSVNQLKSLWREVDTKWRKPKLQWTMFMSHSTYEAYEDKLETISPNNGRGEDMLKPMYLRGSNGLCMLKPCTWMGDSERVILTPKANMIVGADAIEQSLAEMDIIPILFGFELGIAAAIGFQFRYLPLLYVNERA